MNWFDALFGSLKNPVFGPDTVASGFTNYSGRNNSSYITLPDAYIVDISDEGYYGWMKSEEQNQTTYIHGHIIKDETYSCKILEVSPYLDGYPHKIIITNRDEGYIVDAWFKDLRPFYGSVDVANGQVIRARHFYDKISTFFVNEISLKHSGSEFDILATNFVNDPLVKMAYSAALQNKDITAIIRLMRASGCEVLGVA